MNYNVQITGTNEIVFLEDKSIESLNSYMVRNYKLEKNSFKIYENNNLITFQKYLDNSKFYRIEPKLRGGKGGFGSLLKTQPAIKKKITNFDSCRDLTGKRLRYINQEKQIKEYNIKKKKEEAVLEQYMNPTENKINLVKSNKNSNIDFENFQMKESEVTNSVLSSIKFLKRKRAENKEQIYNKKEEKKSKQKAKKLNDEEIKKLEMDLFESLIN